MIKNNLNQSKPLIYIPNHTSYIDSLALFSILPAGVGFVAKSELFKFSPVRFLLEKLGHLMVKRRDVTQSLEDLKKMEEAIHHGQSLVIFPEGTFTEIVGLRQFKLGAFKLAVETQTPLLPIVISGTRKILPADSWLMRPGTITITVLEPLKPEGTEWSEVIRLKTAAREEISKHCGDPVYHQEIKRK